MATANRTFFVPKNICRLRLQELSLSAELAAVLRKLRITTFGDLTGVSLSDFLHMSYNGIALFSEVGHLLKRARRGDFGTNSFEEVKKERLPSRGCDTHAHGRIVKTNQFASKKPIANDVACVSAQEDTIFIPQEARGRLLSSFSMSVRLHHIFEIKMFRLLGELHGLTYNEISKYRNCGRKTVEEIRQLVRSVQLGRTLGTATVDELPYASPHRSDCVSIPAYAREFNPLDLPISVRLANALESKGIVRLGDLHGRDLAEFKGLANCGKRTRAELDSFIERIASGEFRPAVGDFLTANVIDLLRLIDDGFAKLPKHWREMLLLRLGGDPKSCWTLEEVGQKFRLTRERIRQITKKSFAQLKKIAGPKMAGYLRGVAGTCAEKVCPLSPALLTSWLGEKSAETQFPPAVYVRLLGELDSGIPVWPRGQEPSSASDRDAEVLSERKALVRRQPEQVNCPLHRNRSGD